MIPEFKEGDLVVYTKTLNELIDDSPKSDYTSIKKYYNIVCNKPLKIVCCNLTAGIVVNKNNETAIVSFENLKLYNSLDEVF